MSWQKAPKAWLRQRPSSKETSKIPGASKELTKPTLGGTTTAMDRSFTPMDAAPHMM